MYFTPFLMQLHCLFICIVVSVMLFGMYCWSSCSFLMLQCAHWLTSYSYLSYCFQVKWLSLCYSLIQGNLGHLSRHNHGVPPCCPCWSDLLSMAIYPIPSNRQDVQGQSWLRIEVLLSIVLGSSALLPLSPSYLLSLHYN